MSTSTSASAGLERPVVGLGDAVREHVVDGSSLYLGNFGAQLFCVGHELIRQQRVGLDLVVASGGLLLDQLLGAGVVASATFGHCWSPVGPSPAWNFRRLAESGDRAVRTHEMSLGLLTAALTAGAWRVPFMPVTGLPGTGYVDEDWTGGMLATASTPFGDSSVVRAIAADVAFVHADVADRQGNAVIRGPVGEAVVAAQGADTVVVVAEEVMPPGERLRGVATLPGLMVDAVVPRPGAAWPDGAVGRYDRDVTAYEEYAARAATSDGYRAWLEELRSRPDPHADLISSPDRVAE